MNKIIDLMPKWAKRIYFRYKVIRHYDDMVAKAEKLHMEYDGERIYVVALPNTTLALLTRDGFRDSKRKGFIDKGFTMNDVRNICVYMTASNFERDPMTPDERTEKRKMYVQYAVDTIVG